MNRKEHKERKDGKIGKSRIMSHCVGLKFVSIRGVFGNGVSTRLGETPKCFRTGINPRDAGATP